MIKLELDVAEVNGVLQALSRMPYAQVAGLIGKIQIQAQPQVEAIKQAEEKPVEAA